MAFFPSLKHNFIAYRSFKVSDCILEIHQLWQSGFSRVYSNYCCSFSFEHEIIKIGQSSHKMYSNNILNFQESTTDLNAHTKKSLETYRMHLVYIYIYIYIYHMTWYRLWPWFSCTKQIVGRLLIAWNPGSQSLPFHIYIYIFFFFFLRNSFKSWGDKENIFCSEL